MPRVLTRGLRLPPPFDAIEPDARARIAQKLHRGTIHVAFTAQRETTTPDIRVNEDLLRKLIAAVAAIPLPAMIYARDPRRPAFRARRRGNFGCGRE